MERQKSERKRTKGKERKGPMAKEKISIKMGGVDFPIRSKEGMRAVFNQGLLYLYDPWQSLEQSKSNLISFLELVYEAASGGQQSRITRTIKSCKTIKTLDQFRSFYFDLILANEGKPLLRGFGFANTFGDKISGNAERVSLLDLKGGKYWF